MLKLKCLTRLNYKISIHQITGKNKAKPYQYISNHKAKFLTFLI